MQRKRLIRDLPRIRKAAGDKAYSSRVNCQAVADKGGEPFLCFKANATAKAKGYPAWQISFEAYSNNKDEWMGEYHIRSVVESVFSSIKRCFGPDIKSIKGWLKRRELAIKVLAYNININCFNPKNPGQNSFPVLTQRDRELTFTGPSTFIVIFK